MTTGHGKDYAEALLKRADKALEAARTLLEKCLLADAISRAYYSMFYATQAILFSKGLVAKTHAGTANVFSKEIVEKDIVPRELGRMFNRVHSLRQKADYSVGIDFELDEVEKVIEEAEYFVISIKESLFKKD